MKFKYIFIVLALVLFTGLLVRYLDRVPQRHYCDFRVYYKSGQDLVKGKDIYLRDNADVTPFKYSPFFAFVFVPLSLLPIKASAAVFFAFNFILTILFFKLSFQLARDSGIAKVFSDREILLIYGLTMLCSMRYVFLVWDSGQVNILMCVLVLLALSFLSKNRAMGAGVFLASSILIKYTPALFLPYFFIQKKYKAILSVVLFSGIFLMFPVLIVGIEKNFHYLSSWLPSIVATSLDRASFIDPKNQSIFSMVLRYFIAMGCQLQASPALFNQVLWYGRIAALFVYLSVFIPGRSDQRNKGIDASLLMICMSLFNPNGWLLNFVSLVPAYMLLIQYIIADKGKDKIILFSLIAAFVMTNIMSKDILGKTAEDFGCFYSFTALGSLIIYSALLKLKFSRI